MIRSTTVSVRESRDIHDLPMAEFLAAVQWGGNCRPVEPGTEKAVLEAHRGEPRPTKLKPTRRDVEDLTPTALRILQLFASGMGHGAIAEKIGVHRSQLARFRKWMGLYHRLNVRHIDDVQAVLEAHGCDVPEFEDRRAKQPGRRVRR